MRKIISLITAIVMIFSVISAVNFTAAAVSTNDEVINGIDVSYWQGQIDWTKVPESGVKFAILRACHEGKDTWFDYNYENATANGIAVGAYVYCCADSVEEAVAEAHLTLDILDGRKLDYPLFVDIESEIQAGLGPNVVSQIVLTELNIFEDAGYVCGYYSYTSYVSNYINVDMLVDYDCWIAEYSDSLGYANPYTMWQYTSSGSISGIAGRCDLDYSYVDYAKVTKSAHGSSSYGFYTVNDCENFYGWTGNQGTVVTVDRENHTNGNRSLSFSRTADGSENIISADCVYEGETDLSQYETLSFDYCLNESWRFMQGTLELSFLTADGAYKAEINLAGQSKGWHTFEASKDELIPTGNADWKTFKGLELRVTDASGDSTENILLDNIKLHSQLNAQPSGNILKVTYENDGDAIGGYKFLDRLGDTVSNGYSLVYDVYLCDDVAGIGGVDLYNNYGKYARNDPDYYDQNGIYAHPSQDITDYACGKWYRRSVTLPESWDGGIYKDFFLVIAFDGFEGKATAYFDNIRYVDSQGNDVAYFYKDGGDEFEYDGRRYTGNADGITITSESYEALYPEVVNADNLINALPDAEKITLIYRGAVEAARKAYNAVPDEVKGMVSGLSRLTAAEEALNISDISGDVNNDGKADSADALKVLQYTVGKAVFGSAQMKSADVNADGTVDSKDALVILQKAVGKTK